MMKTISRWLACLLVSMLVAPSFATTHPAQAAPGLHVPAKDRRSPDQTYLTFPEWFLVFSPDEYARLLKTGHSSDFPWFRHIGQFWSSYAQVIKATRKYPFNGEYHLMIVVIGTSTTVEYGIKGIYETLIGRLTELTCAPNATAEDRLAAREAQDYVDFIRVHPWYEFDFAARLKQLWTKTPMRGPHQLRKWERRYLLTSEWGVKAIYGWVIGKATHSAFAEPKASTMVVVRDLPSNAELPHMQRLQSSDDETLLVLPRYQAFTDAALTLAQSGARFVEIAGNRDIICISMVVPMAAPIPDGARVLIRQPIVTRPGFERRVLQVPIGRLSSALESSTRNDETIEHVFDF